MASLKALGAAMDQFTFVQVGREGGAAFIACGHAAAQGELTVPRPTSAG